MASRRDPRRCVEPGDALGFRCVSIVRARVDSAPTSFEVEGVVHRHPVTRAVSATSAARLVASGVPLVICDDIAPAASSAC